MEAGPIPERKAASWPMAALAPLGSVPLRSAAYASRPGRAMVEGDRAVLERLRPVLQRAAEDLSGGSLWKEALGEFATALDESLKLYEPLGRPSSPAPPDPLPTRRP